MSTSQAGKLAGPPRQRLLQLIAEYEPPSRAIATLQREFGLTIGKPTFYHYVHHPRWKDAIQGIRQALNSQIANLPISNKYYRLRVMQRELIAARKWRLARYSKAGETKYIPVYEKAYSAIEGLLRLAAQELGELEDALVLRDRRYVAQLADGRPIGVDKGNGRDRATSDSPG